MRISDLAVQIITHSAGAPERVKAVGEAAAKPDIFKELDFRFPAKASDHAIRAYLLTQKFIPNAANGVIRSYRETKALVEAEAAGCRSGTQGPDHNESVTLTQPPVIEGCEPGAPPDRPQSSPIHIIFATSQARVSRGTFAFRGLPILSLLSARSRCSRLFLDRCKAGRSIQTMMILRPASRANQNRRARSARR